MGLPNKRLRWLPGFVSVCDCPAKCRITNWLQRDFHGMGRWRLQYSTCDLDLSNFYSMLIYLARKNQTDSSDVGIDSKIRRIACWLLRSRILDGRQGHLVIGSNGYCVTQRCVNEFHQEFKASGDVKSRNCLASPVRLTCLTGGRALLAWRAGGQRLKKHNHESPK